MRRDPVLVDLALQGGGAHGAFTWGVLDRLLEEPWLRIDGISGTSAGAMNAAVLADGHAEGGAEGARAALERFWRSVSQRGAAQPVPARAARRAARPLDARQFPGLRRSWTSPRGCSRPTTSTRAAPTRCARSWPRRSTSTGSRARRSSCSSPPPMCTPAGAASSATPRSRRTCCSPRPACRPCSRRSRSTARPTGTAATPATRPSRPWSASATARHHPGADQPGRAPGHAAHGARHPQPGQRGLLQRRAAEGAAHDRPAAPGRRPRRLRGRAVGGDAHPPDRKRRDGGLGYSSKLNAEWEFLRMLRDEGRRAADAFLAAHASTWGGAPRSTSTRCWRGCETLALLIWLDHGFDRGDRAGLSARLVLKGCLAGRSGAHPAFAKSGRPRRPSRSRRPTEGSRARRRRAPDRHPLLHRDVEPRHRLAVQLRGQVALGDRALEPLAQRRDIARPAFAQLPAHPGVAALAQQRAQDDEAARGPIRPGEGDGAARRKRSIASRALGACGRAVQISVPSVAP